MPLTRRLPAVLSVLVGLALAVAGGLAPDAHARALPAGPDLSIESKVCSIGPTVAERSVAVTASAILGRTGDHVSLRFGIQQRLTSKAKWRSVPGTGAGASDGLGTWEDGEPGRPGLRYAKTINGLAEGIGYRVLVDARGVDVSGRPVTRTARRTVSCTQPLFTPTLQLGRISVIGSGDDRAAVVTVRNDGRLAADGPGFVTVYDAVKRTVLGTSSVVPLEGGSTTKITVPITSCASRIYVIVQRDPDADLVPGQYRTVTCSTKSR